MIRVFLIIVTMLIVGCGSESLRPVAAPAEQAMSRGDWVGAMQYYRQNLATNPDSAELRRGFLVVSERAEAHFAEQAMRSAAVEDFGSASRSVQQGLIVVPESIMLANMQTEYQDSARARPIYNEAAAAARLGRFDRAMERVEAALALDPNYDDALSLFTRLSKQQTATQAISPIRLTSSAPVTVNFRDAGFKEALLALGENYGVNMIFDAAIEDRPVTLFAEDVSFTQAFQLLLKSNGAFYHRLGRNSVVIAPDTAEGRAAYEDYVVQTFYLETMDAASAADLVTRSLGIANVTVSEAGNALTVRDNRERLQLVAQLLSNNDRAPAEVVMEVEILEINRTKSEQLGLDFGSQISISPPSVTVGDFGNGGASEAFQTSIVSLPAATFRFFKQDVDANTLASPRIRTVNNREALIHIGDRVPLRSSTIQDATGQTRTTFEYRDVGIKVNVTPQIKLDRSVVVTLELEVSSLGQNLGTADEPAFAIGTRNVSTQMALNDGETAVIGGLIRDEDRDTRQRVPGLGDIPAIGRIFATRDGQGTRTDILLTLTPRIIRARDVPSNAEAQIFSGSGARVTTQATQDFLTSNPGNTPTIRLDLSGGAAPTLASASIGALPSTAPIQPTATPTSQSGSNASLAFSRSSYDVNVGAALDTSVTASGFGAGTAGTATIRYRADLVQATSVTTTGGLPYEIDNSKGEIRLTLNETVAAPGTLEIANISFEGIKAGLSYLIFSSDFGDGPKVEVPDGIELQSSRIAVR